MQGGNVNSQNKILDLLSKAYSAADDFAKIDDLMEDMSGYLFENDDQTISENLPRYSGYDPHLELHIEQLNRLMSKQNNDEQMGLSLVDHAQLVLSHDGRVITANSHARALLNGTFFGDIDELPFGFETIKKLNELLKEISAGVQNLDRIIYLQIDAKQKQQAFGYCRSIPIGNGLIGLHISFSYFVWSSEILKGLEAALGLTTREGSVLQGVLNGESRLEIAVRRKRSVGTIKAQANAILQKSGCANLNELAHLCTSIAYVIGLSEAQAKQSKIESLLETPRQSLHMLRVDEGRQLAYYEYGDKNGQPVVYFHGYNQGPFFLDEMKLKFLKHGLRLIAPSRPSFGYTSPPLSHKKYAQTVTSDMLSLFKHLNLNKDVIILTHHEGNGFAFRLVKEIGQKIAGMVMMGGDIPITNEHLPYMSKQVKMAAVALRHAPSIMRILVVLGVKNYGKHGINALMNKSYFDLGLRGDDLALIDDKTIRPILIEGLQHMLEQGPDTFMLEGQARMIDWTQDFNAVNCQQYWLQGEHCPIIQAQAVKNYVNGKTNHSINVVEGAGYNILFQAFDLILEKIVFMKSQGEM